MQIGRRVAKLRESHGESLREAAVRTGVSHTTIARIEKGEVVASFQSTLRKIAEGYGVRVEFLLAGKDPRQGFAFSLSRLSQEERSRLNFVPARTRIRMVLQFLLREYPSEFSLQQFAASAAMDLQQLQSLHQGEAVTMTEAEDIRLAEALSRIIGIPNHWFRFGTMGDLGQEPLPPATVSAFVNLMKKAAAGGVKPEILEMAIELLIMENREFGDRKEPAGNTPS